MSEINYNVRMTQKIDTEKTWINSNLVPKKGEIIVYTAEDSTTELPSGRTTPISSPRVKVGDGVSAAKDLPFLTLDFNDLLNIPNYMKKQDPTGSGSLQMNPITDHTTIGWETEGNGVSLGTNCAARHDNLAGGYATYNVTGQGGSIAWGNGCFIGPQYSEEVQAFGRYNDCGDDDQYKFMYGDGSSDSNRSNCMTLDCFSDLWIKGDFYFGGTSKATATKLAPYTAGSGISIDNNEISTKFEWEEF